MGVEQRARIGLSWCVDNLRRRAELDQLAMAEHGDALGELGRQRDVVADEQQRHAVLGHQSPDQGDDLGLDDGVERAGRLVGDEQFRARRNRGGDRHTLLLAAGELMREGAQGRVRVGQADAFEQVFALAYACGHVRSRWVYATSAICLPTVITGSRLAEGSWKTKPMSRPGGASWRARGWPAVRKDQSIRPFNPRRARQQPGNRQRQRALARTAFADDRQALAGNDIETDPSQRRHLVAIPPVGHRQIADRSQRGHDRLRLTAVVSTTPSPAR